jgi:AraC family transcriptional regulator
LNNCWEKQVGATQQITVIVNGQIVPVTKAPLLTSASTSWSGFLLECHAPKFARGNVWCSWHRTHINLVTKGTLTFRVRQFGKDEWFSARTGSVSIIPKGFGEICFSVDQFDCELTCVELDPALLTKALDGKNAPALDALTPQLVIEDAQIAALLTNMKMELSQGCSNGRLYAQSLSVALAAYLEKRFCPEGNPSQKRFSHSQIEALQNYIAANLADEVSPGDLADLVQMSTRQFFRFFSSTFGSTPHQYLMKERVRRAKELLSGGSLSIDVAKVLGFSTQSHFNQVFKKITGATPGRFRRVPTEKV